YFDNSIGQILPGNSDPDPDAFIDLTALGIDPPSTGSLTIVPEGFPGEGRLKITSYDNGNFYDALLIPNDDGTYDVTVEGNVDLIPEEDGDSRGLEGIVFVDESYPGFTTDTVLISQFDTNTINAFEVDDLGNPILETESIFLDGLTGSGVGGVFGFIADPVTGDFLVSLDSAFTADDTDLGGRLLLITDEAPPTAVADNDPFDDVTELDISGGEATASGGVSTSNEVYGIDAKAGELLSIDVNVTEVLTGIAYTNDDTQLYLYNEAGDVLAFSEDKPSSLASNVLNYLVPENGTYYAAVTTAGNEPILELGEVNQLLGFEETGLANVVYDITASAMELPDTARLFEIALEDTPEDPIGEVLIDGEEVLFIDLNGTRNTDATGVLPIEVNAEEVNSPENTLDNTISFEDTLSFGLDAFDFILDFDEPFASTDVDDIVDSLETSGITAIVPPDELIQRVVFTEVEVPSSDLVPVFGSVDADVIEVEGGNQLIFAGDSNDLVDASTGAGDNRIYTSSGDDTVILGTGDRLIAGDGDDAIFVTDGGDNILTGGVGADQFWIASAELPEAANIITDFTSGEDVIGIAGLGIGFEDVSITNLEGDALVAATGSDLAILQGIDATSLTGGDFTFA
ncbi:MAG: hypothetical protein AAGA16_17800, partial [Cyanobacteria bacterium P01_E01_bin.35]